MRHPIPIVAAALTTLFVSAGLGLGLTHWFQIAWPILTFPAVGLSLVVWGLVKYWKLAAGRQSRVYRYCCVLMCGEFGLVFGGIPGAIVGRYFAGDVGECIGWFASGLLLAAAAGRWGWHWSAQYEQVM